MIFKTLHISQSNALSIKHIIQSSLGKKKQIVFLVFLLLLAYNQKISSQTNQEKKFSNYYSKAVLFSYKNNDSLIFYAKKIQMSMDICQKVDGILYEAKGYYQKSDFETSKKLVFLAIKLSEKKVKDCDRKNLVDAYGRLFYIAKNEDNYDSALTYLHARKEIVETFPKNSEYRIKNIIGVEYSIAILKIKVGAYNEALEILQRSYKEIQKIKLAKPTLETEKNLSLYKVNILNSIGDIFVYLYIKKSQNSNLDSANLYYKRAFNLVESLPNPNTDNFVIYQLRRIKVLVWKKDYKLALFNLNRYDSLFKKNSPYLSNYYHLKATSLRHEKKYDSSIYFANKYLELHKPQKKYNKNVILVYDNIANSYLGKKMSDSAIFYSNLALEKLKEIQNSKQYTSIKIYKKELEEVKLLNEKLNNKSSISFVNIFLIIVVIIIISFFILKKRKKSFPSSKKRFLEKEIELKILEGISQFENSKMYLNSDFNINILSKHLNTNSTYLSIVINKYKKKPFKQYLSELRINYLVEQLKDDSKLRKYTIKGLGEEIGYTNASSFSRSFKNFTGLTPTNYLNSLK